MFFGKKDILSDAEPHVSLFHASRKPETASIDAIRRIIRSSRGHLVNFDLEHARLDYEDALRIYAQLHETHKHEVYPEIKDLYEDRMSAESLNTRFPSKK